MAVGVLNGIRRWVFLQCLITTIAVLVWNQGADALRKRLLQHNSRLVSMVRGPRSTILTLLCVSIICFHSAWSSPTIVCVPSIKQRDRQHLLHRIASTSPRAYQRSWACATNRGPGACHGAVKDCARVCDSLGGNGCRIHPCMLRSVHDGPSSCCIYRRGRVRGLQAGRYRRVDCSRSREGGRAGYAGASGLVWRIAGPFALKARAVAAS